MFFLCFWYIVFAIFFGISVCRGIHCCTDDLTVAPMFSDEIRTEDLPTALPITINVHCCLYGAGRHDFYAGNIHFKGHWKRWALKIETFWALKWQQAKRVSFGPKKVEKKSWKIARVGSCIQWTITWRGTEKNPDLPTVESNAAPSPPARCDGIFPPFFKNLRIFSLCFVYYFCQSQQSLWVNHRLITSAFILLLGERILAVISLVPSLWKDTIIQISSTTQLLNNC